MIRDPVHNLIRFDSSETDRLLLKLINTKEFQRLRRICQLGVTPLVFPGANHTRFAHSIGVLHVARRMLDRLQRLDNVEITENQRRIVLAAALLHDVGHGPYSHAFESITGENHERRTADIIRFEESEVNEVLVKVDPDLPLQIANIIVKDLDASTPQVEMVPDFLSDVVSSQLDADRFDYLLRDAYCTGASYGAFDIDWLIEHLIFDDQRNRVILGLKAMHDAEAYVFARYRMYRNVYFHKATRSAEVMLRLAFRRFLELLDNPDAPLEASLPKIPESLRRAFGVQADGSRIEGKMQLADYLLLDDHTVTEFFKVAAVSADPTLAELATGLLSRKLYKSIDVTDMQPIQLTEFHHRARVEVTKGVDLPDYCFASDSPSDLPYKPYNPDDSNPATQIYIEQRFGDPVELATISRSVQTLRDRWAMTRFYFPENLRPMIDEVAHQTSR